MKKRILAIGAALLLCLLVLPVLAAETPVMAFEVSPQIHPGDTVTVAVTLSPVEGCTALGLSVVYDTEIFEMVEDSFTLHIDDVKQHSFKYLAAAGGYVAQLQMDGAADLSGQIFSFQLRVKGTVAIGTKTELTGKPSLRLNNNAAECGLENATVTVACSHSFGPWARLDGGSHQRTCSNCGQTEKAAHGWDGGKVTQEATCTAEGVKTYTCADCGATKTEAISQKEHTWDGGKITSQPTCDAQGEMTYTCTACGATYQETLGKLEHVYDQGVVTTPATCTTDGVKTFTCTDCADSYTQTIPATGHTAGSPREENRKEPDCETDGGYDTVVSCETCGAELSREHHTLAATGHDYNSGDITTAPTCVAEGVKTFTCRSCWKTYTEPVPVKEHEPGEEWIDSWVDQGCETEGSYDTVVNCKGCGAELSRVTTAIAPNGHDYTNRCDTECDVCGAIRETEHNYSERLTFDSSGHWHACEECGEILELLPHVPGPEATETEDQLCLDCGYVIHPAGYHEHKPVGDWLSDENGHYHQCACTEKLEEAPHSWSEGTVEEAAGQIRYFCTVCGYNRTEPWQPETEPVSPPDTQPDTQPGTQPDPGQTEPTETRPSAGDPGQSGGFPWWILVVALGAVLLGVTIYVIAGILISRKKVGRFSK